METTALLMLRATFVVTAASMLALWGWSLVAPIENWNNASEDGFSYVPAFYATIVCLPTGRFLLAGAIAGRGRHLERAHLALLVGAATLFIVVAVGESSRVAFRLFPEITHHP
jgi:hypothetical protein